MKSKTVSLRTHNREVSALKSQIDGLRNQIKATAEENRNNLGSLRTSVEFCADLSSKASAKFQAMQEALDEMHKRIDKFEPIIKSFLDAKQREFAKALGISEVEYGIQYLRLLYENRDIIHAARSLQ